MILVKWHVAHFIFINNNNNYDLMACDYVLNCQPSRSSTRNSVAKGQAEPKSHVLALKTANEIIIERPICI